jgi:hypothetical protein
MVFVKVDDGYMMTVDKKTLPKIRQQRKNCALILDAALQGQRLPRRAGCKAAAHQHQHEPKC